MTDEMTMKKPWWKRILRTFAIVVVVLFLVVLVIHSVWNYIVAKQIHQEIVRIRTAGEPVTFNELALSFNEVDEKNNAGRYYEAALALLVGEQDLHELQEEMRLALVELPKKEPSPERLQRLEQFLVRNVSTLEMLDLAAKHAECDFDMFDSMGQTLERLGRVRGVARLVSIRTRSLALKGHSDEAVASLIALLRINRIFQKQPILVVDLVRTACVALAVIDLQVVLEVCEPSAQALLKLQKVLMEAEQPEALYRMMIAERVYAITVLQNVISGATDENISPGEGQDLPEAWGVNLASMPAFRHMAAAYLRDLRYLTTALQNDWPKIIDAISALPEPKGLSAVITPALDKTVIQVGRGLAHVRCARVAVMIERSRMNQGKLPESLRELTPEYSEAVPQDPFTGEELLYRKTNDDYVVYSVSDNRTDDNGIVERQERSGAKKISPDWGVRIRLRLADR